MLPLRDANPTARTPFLTLAIIAANVAAFLLWQPTFEGGEEGAFEQQTFFWCQAAIPFEVAEQTSLARSGPEGATAIAESYDVSAADGRGLQDYLAGECGDKSWLASIVVAMFLHGGWLHIAGNMLFLWVFGNNVEDRLGRVVFPVFYLLGGLAAFALHFAFDTGSAIPTLGASGAISAVLGAYIVLYPRARVLTLVFRVIVELPAIVVLGGWFVLQLFSGVGQLGTDVSVGVAYWAHIGGFVFGLVVALLFLRRPAAGAWGPAAATL
jgi:membrane associated rhomboid family serine protease